MMNKEAVSKVKSKLIVTYKIWSSA